VTGSLMAVLDARIRRFTDSGDRAAVLDPVTVVEAGRLWETAVPPGGGSQAAPVDVLLILARLHTARYQAMPGSEGQPDLRMALGIVQLLDERAPERIPDGLREVLAASEPEPTPDAERASIEGFQALDEYQRTGRPALLDTAVASFRHAVATSLAGSLEHAGELFNLARVLQAKFRRTGDHADLDVTIGAWREAADAAPVDHLHRASCQVNLGTALRTRFELTGNEADLDAAIEAFGQAAVSIPAGYPQRDEYLNRLSSARLTRFELTGQPPDLDAALKAVRQALTEAPPGHPSRSGYLGNLSNIGRIQFQLAGDASILDEAVDAGIEAVATAPPDYPELALCLSNLGVARLARFGLTGNAADLDAAVDAAEQAVAATAPGHPSQAGLLNNQGIALRTRFGLTGNEADLDAAVDAARRAVAVGTRGRHGDRAAMLANLGAALSIRFNRTSDAADLDEAVAAGRQAVAATPPGSPELARHQGTLGNELRLRFERAGDAADLDEAIEAQRKAMAATPPGSPELAGSQSNLSVSLRLRFERAGDAADLDEAAVAGHRAVAATPPGHPGRAPILSNLGTVLLTKYGRTGDVEDLVAAIDTCRQAVAATPGGHPNRTDRLINLAGALQAMFERTRDGADLDAALRCFREASEVPTGAPGSRLGAARRWAVLAADNGRVHTAVDAYTVAVRLLPVVAWAGLDRATRQEQLAQWAGLAADAASCAVLDGRPEFAVELLEQGRSLLWAQALNLRGDLTRLAGTVPALARRLDRIRATLDAPLFEPAQAATAVAGPGRVGDGTTLTGRSGREQEAAELRIRAAREWDEVLAEVRAMPGFEHFLDILPYSELVGVATHGPVVIVNTGRHGGHALIVTAGSRQAGVIPLPGLTMEAAVLHANGLLSELLGAVDPDRSPQDRPEGDWTISGCLDWLWTTVAEPVLTALGHAGLPADDQWPRVWWCPTGALSILPIHAARRDSGGPAADGADCVLDRVISSYTPTLTALARARRDDPAAAVRQLTVGMPVTPGLTSLPAVRSELTILAQRFPPGELHQQLVGPQATRAAVMAALSSHSWMHLSCHAQQDHDDPAASGFVLWDGELTISGLAGESSQRRDLAFLSACETAAGSVRHMDEAIHLAAAMQFLGFRHVVATMWVVTDLPAATVASAFYTELTRDGQPDSSRAAAALHQAVRSLRGSVPDEPLLWAPYIHFGP
jgi:tetratricopeptide (TPR) repeat protein